MISLSLPKAKARATFLTCISKVQDADLKARLVGIVTDVANASTAFAAAASAGRLHLIPRQSLVGAVTVEEMGDVYSYRMVPASSPGRAIYDELKAGAPNGRCPYCVLRDVVSLDHYLPKAHYPALAVAPLNLIPACDTCNKAKLDQFPSNPAEVPLHPYFENIEMEEWLRAKLIKTQPATMEFLVKPPSGWSAVFRKRVHNYFDSFGLASFYASQAADELSNIRGSLASILNSSAGTKGVKAHLLGEAASRRLARINGWRTAAYDAWAASDWFCSGGFVDVG